MNSAQAPPDSTRGRSSLYVLTMTQGSLFPEPCHQIPDDEVVETLRAAIARAGRLPRSADMMLCGLCAEYLAGELRGAGLLSCAARQWAAAGERCRSYLSPRTDPTLHCAGRAV